MRELGSTDWDHASWLESFPWINQPVPIKQQFKEQTHVEDHYALSAAETRPIMATVSAAAITPSRAGHARILRDLCPGLVDYLENGFNKTGVCRINFLDFP